MSGSIFTLFLGFALVWILLGIGGIVLLMRSQNQPLHVNADALLVSIPILLVFVIALSFSAVVFATGG